MKKEWINLLHRSFEDDLSKEETTRLTNALKESAELRKEQTALIATRNLFTSFSVTKDEAFVAAIMNTIEQENIVAKRQIGHYLSQIFPIAIAACLLIFTSFMVSIYISEGNLDSETLVGINDLSPDEAYTYLMEE